MPVSFITASRLAVLAGPEQGRPFKIIDARRRRQFDSGHIPGAIHLDWRQWCEHPPPGAGLPLQAPGYWGALADPVRERFAARLSEAGLSNDDQIVVYGDSHASGGAEGRIAWMLLYLGAQEVSLLQDGWQAWLVGGYPVESGIKSGGNKAQIDRFLQGRGNFKISLVHRRRVRLGQLEPAARGRGGTVLVDTRSRLEFHGFDFDYQPRKGRLPRSVLVPFRDLFDGQGSYLCRAAYLRLVPAALLEADSIIAYCEVGVRACSFALLNEIHTGKVVPVYDGSIMEWSLHRRLPLLSEAAAAPVL